MSSHLSVQNQNTSTNILYIYHHIDTIGGIETRWMDEFKYLSLNNYNVYLLTNQRCFKNEIAKLFPTCLFITVDIDSPSLASDFIKIVDKTISIIQSENIQIVSIHMLDLFACASIIAAQVCKIPVISTIHGPLDIYRRPFNRLFIQQLAGKSFSLSIYVSKILESIMPPHKGTSAIIPNLIDLKKYKHVENIENSDWLLVSRISAEKYVSIMSFLKAANDCKISTVDIAGGGNITDLDILIKKLNLKTKVNYLGEIEDMALIMPLYYGIAGMARVAIEGLACKKPVCIIAFDGTLIGLITSENFERLKAYNFTGEGIAAISHQQLLYQLDNYELNESEVIYQQLEKELSVEKWNHYINLYQEVSFIENEALEALYHKIVYFSHTLSRPFEQDKFFWHLLYETIIEHKLDDIKEIWQYYDISIGLSSNYPNPYNINSTSKKNWLSIFK